MTRLARALDAAVAVALGVGLAAAVAGPLHFAIGGASVSVRTLARPFVAALVLLAVRLWLARRERAAAGTVVAAAVLRALILASAVLWIVFLSPTVGGADSYGYVSAADRLLEGRLVQDEPLARLMPFPEGIMAASPLGYVPAGRVPDATVPAYPLGLPLVMAGAKAIGGTQAPFWVAPLAAVVLLLATFVTARRWYDDTVALLATALVAINPLVFTYAIQPMSDVPAAAALIGGVAWLVARRPRPILAGTAAGLALAMRPALAPAAALLAVLPLSTPRRRWRDVARYAAVVVAAAALQAGSQWYLYGSPFSSGYGSVAGLFSWQTAAINAQIYTHWGWLALGPAWLAAVGVGLAWHRSREASLVLGLLTLAIGLPYLFYRPFDHWETLRFLLPVVVAASIVAADGLLAAATRAFDGRFALAAAAAVAVALAFVWLEWVTAQHVLTMPQHEARHRTAGELVRQATAANGVIIALQHSGSLRYYTDRQTLNWERIPDGRLPSAVAALQAAGRPVYVMIDSAEERALFEQRHGRVLDTAQWLPGGQRADIQLFEAAPPGSRR